MELDTIRLWTEDSGEPEPVNGGRINRYINTYERPGSVSLVDSIDVDGLGGVYEFDELPTKMKERLLPYV